VELPAGVAPGSAEDARCTRAEALTRGARGAGALVVDGYGFDAGYLAEIRAPGLVTAYVDDLLRRGLPVDVVVNPNAGACAEDYREGAAAGPAEILAGARYALLREEFRAGRRRRSGEPAGEPGAWLRPLHLLIAFGGSDPAGVTARALEAAIAAGPQRFDRITVLVGPLHPSAGALRDLACCEAPRVSLRSVSPGGVAALLAGVDVALGAAGGTSWELACMGVPMLLVEVADNQRAVAEPLAACGAAQRLGRVDRLTADDLAASLGRLAEAGAPALRAMSEAGARLIDGEGARRVAGARWDLGCHSDVSSRAFRASSR
jgi:spore coat polysaccharide biosynthesis predicted glycosyltransferase SpsG